jgi:CheY-like chemotaxis protein
VLVVDDNQDAADSLGELLSALGYRPSVAYDPAHAIALAAAMPDVAILDIGLPGMDGFELAGHLRHAAGADLKLLALSGYGREMTRHAAAKPASTPTLLNRSISQSYKIRCHKALQFS